MVVMAWLEKVHFHFTNLLIIFGRVPFFYYGAHLLLAHLIEIGMNFVGFGAKSFLLIARPSMGSSSELFPVDWLTMGSRCGRCMRSGLWYCCFSIRHAFGSRDSNNVGMIDCGRTLTNVAQMLMNNQS
jgi:hypothetical protein